jgi:hypothetical protein
VVVHDQTGDLSVPSLYDCLLCHGLRIVCRRSESAEFPNSQTAGLRADDRSMGRSAIGLGAVLGGTVGSYIPVVLWGASSF